MDNFYNIAGADIGSLVGSTIGTGISMLLAKQSQKNAKRAQEQLQLLSQAQLDDLNQKVLSAKTELEKETLFFKYLSDQQKIIIDKATKKHRIITGIALGTGVLISFLLIIKIRKQHE